MQIAVIGDIEDVNEMQFGQTRGHEAAGEARLWPPQRLRRCVFIDGGNNVVFLVLLSS